MMRTKTKKQTQNENMLKRRCKMTDKEFTKIKSIVRKEIKSYKEKLLRKDSKYLFKNAREIYATKFISDCLTDEDFMGELDFNTFNHKKLLKPITNCYLKYHSEIRESDLTDMFNYYVTELQEFYNKSNESEM